MDVGAALVCAAAVVVDAVVVEIVAVRAAVNANVVLVDVAALVDGA